MGLLGSQPDRLATVWRNPLKNTGLADGSAVLAVTVIKKEEKVYGKTVVVQRRGPAQIACWS